MCEGLNTKPSAPNRAEEEKKKKKQKNTEKRKQTKNGAVASTCDRRPEGRANEARAVDGAVLRGESAAEGELDAGLGPGALLVASPGSRV